MKLLTSYTARLSSGQYLSLALVLGFVLLLSGCVEAVVESGEAGEAVAAGTETAPAAEPAGAAADAGAANEVAEEVSAEDADTGGSEETGEALRAAEESAQTPARYVARVDADGLMKAVDELGFKSEVVGRFDGEGQLFEVSRAGRPVRMIAKLESGKLWEVNQSGLPVRVIGSVRVTITGDAVIDVHAGPDMGLSKIATLRRGDVIEITGGVTEWERSWLSVKTHDGLEGWIPRVMGASASDSDDKRRNRPSRIDGVKSNLPDDEQ
jgi:hypothetical protein